jgi:hypothetical protein
MIERPLPACVAARAPTGVRITAAFAFLRSRLVDGQAATLEFPLVEGVARGASLVGTRHFDESESARLPGGSIADQTHGRNTTNRREELFELLFARIERQISYVKSHLHIPLKKLETAGLITSGTCTHRLTQAEQTGGIQRENDSVPRTSGALPGVTVVR